MYVVDSDNPHIQVFIVQNTFVRGWGSQGNVKGKSCHLVGIFVCDQEVYVVDTDNNHIQFASIHYTVQGDFLPPPPPPERIFNDVHLLNKSCKIVEARDPLNSAPTLRTLVTSLNNRG